jgi:hypothetical protein
MHTTEKELLEVTGYKPQRKFSNRQDYLGSVLNSVLKLSNDEFDNLSDEAAEWANAAVQAKNARNQDLPDFDEIEPSEEGEDDDPETENTVEARVEASDNEAENNEDESQISDSEVEAETEVVKPKLVKPKTPPKKSPAKPTPKKAPSIDEEDVVLDKWGAMEGSKNSRALAMFEKGATSKEIKDKLGGTYYNILKKMNEKGHKVEKEGSLIKLTHRDELGKRSPKKK